MKRSMTVSDRFDALFKVFKSCADAQDFEACAMFEIVGCQKERQCELLEIRLAFGHWRVIHGREDRFAGFSHCMPLIFNKIERSLQQK